MLKITPHANPAARSATLVLEGQVAGPWVDELRGVYGEMRRSHGDASITFDLKDVTFIDADGLAFFQEAGPAVIVINCSLFAAEQLKDVLARHEAVRS
jgi:hypothetical protein